jgi:hypothetical protein
MCRIVSLSDIQAAMADDMVFTGVEYESREDMLFYIPDGSEQPSLSLSLADLADYDSAA